MIRIRPYTRGGSLKAFVDLQLGGVTINDCRLIEGQNGLFVAMPQKEVPQPDGGKSYFPIVKLNEGLEQKVREAVLAKWAAIAP